MKATDLAYLAGIIDSDGTIGIKRNTYSMRVIGDSGQPTYSERVCVKQVTPEAIDMLHATFGGYRAVQAPSAKRGKALHAWQVTDKKATEVLRRILPYLRIKRAQATACLELRKLKNQSRAERTAKGRGHKGGKPRPASIGVAMDALKARVGELNRPGV